MIAFPKLEAQQKHRLYQEALWLFSFSQLLVAGTSLVGLEALSMCRQSQHWMCYKAGRDAEH